MTICMFMVFTMTLMAQNPFVAKTDVILDFNISPNGQMIIYREWTTDAISNLQIKKMKTRKNVLISSANLKENPTAEISSGADFLSNNVIVCCKDDYIIIHNKKKEENRLLFKLPDEIGMLCFIKASNDGRGIYVVGFDKVYYASLKDGIVAETDKCKFDETIMSLTVDRHNRAFYTTTARKVYSFDGLNKGKDITSEISKFVTGPYLIEAAHDDNSFIVAGKDAIFKIDLSTGKSVKLMDNNPENRLYIMRLSPDGKSLYYNTIYEKRKIRKLEFADNQSNDSSTQDNVVLDISNK